MSYPKMNYVDLTPAEAREYAAKLLKFADLVEANPLPDAYVYVHCDKPATNGSEVAVRVSKTRIS